MGRPKSNNCNISSSTACYNTWPINNGNMLPNPSHCRPTMLVGKAKKYGDTSIQFHLASWLRDIKWNIA